MSTLIMNQVPQGEDLAIAMLEQEEREFANYAKAKIQRGLDASAAPNTTRTSHAEFMAQLKAQLLSKINARQVYD